jgi:hypothetical protein
VLATETTNPLLIVVLLAFGALVWWNGVKTWRGEEIMGLTGRGNGEGSRSASDGRRRYQTRAGSAHIGAVGGPGFLLVGVGEGLRGIVGETREWWLYELVAGLGGVLIVASGFYLLWYFWFGVPDRLRPPCQRGWEIVDGHLRLVRPEAFHEHPKHASAQGGDRPAGYDPWR